MARLRMTLACWDYDRTRALADGTVRPEGIDLVYLALPVEETFFRMLRHREFDCAEMSLSSYVMSLGRDDRPFVAIPAFPSRFFRHSCIFVSARSGITQPGELAGRRIGSPEYQMTAPVWIRGILADGHGVPVASPQYLTGGEEEPGRTEKLALDLPPTIRVARIGAGQTLARMLADGRIPRDRIRVRLFARHEPWVAALVRRHGIDDVVELLAWTARREALRFQQESQVLLLLHWGGPREEGVYTGKIFEYLAARRPVLVVGGGAGVLSELLKETGAGVHVTDAASLERQLETWWREFAARGSVAWCGRDELIEGYSHRRMAREFAAVLEEVCAGR